MSGRVSYIMWILGFALFAEFAVAGPCAMQCKSKAQKEKAQCDGEAARVKAADTGRSAASSGQNTFANQQTGATSLVGDTAAQKADTQKAASQCKQNEEKCKSECDAEKGKIPSNKACTGDEGQIEETKGSICALIGAMAGELQQAANNLGGDNKAAGDTQKGSGGMPPIPPIPPPSSKDDKKAENAKDTPGTLNCNESQNSRYSDCNDIFIAKCSAEMKQDGCDIFINRYCGPMNGTPTTQAPADINTNPITNFSVNRNSPTANLVADKQGEGMGSAFCGKANGFRFCQTSGREQCPSCQSITNWSTSLSTDQLKSAQSTCPSDPMFADPAIVAQIGALPPPSPTGTPPDPVTGGVKDVAAKSSTTGAVSGATGGGSLSTGTGSISGSVTSGQGGLAEGNQSGVGSLDMTSGSGGSSGSGGGDSESSSSSGSRMGTQSASGPRAPAGALISNAADVANQYGPNIFSISTTTYKSLCSRGKLLHCRER